MLHADGPGHPVGASTVTGNEEAADRRRRRTSWLGSCNALPCRCLHSFSFPMPCIIITQAKHAKRSFEAKLYFLLVLINKEANEKNPPPISPK
jgi:hypothetical protein